MHCQSRGTSPYLAVLLSLSATLAGAAPARAQNQGFTLNRYEPTIVGEQSFMVDHPWYSGTRYFAIGATLNYAHNPLVIGYGAADGGFTRFDTVIEHQLLGHIELAGSFLDRVTIAATLPITLLERGHAAAGVTPLDGLGFGDPRLGVMVRLFGQPDASKISLSIGANVWVPLRKFTDAVATTASDQDVRVLPKLVLAGLGSRIRWSVTGGFLYRPQATIGTLSQPGGSTVGSELQFGALINYADPKGRFAVGPEALVGTAVIGGDPFTRDYTSLELLLGGHYNIGNTALVSLAAGMGILRTPGTPDARVLLRVSYAPVRQRYVDTDGDGIVDTYDACPDQPGPQSDDPKLHGCPPRTDRDGDGVVDADDLCPDTPKGPTPDPARRGCPLADRDGDGVVDADDLCPDVAQGPTPDPRRRGCPLSDRDGDGVADAEDLCPDVAKGPTPDPKRLGCPAGDRDKDGVLDPEDVCPDEPAGIHPDPARRGCPASDRDKDNVPDAVDACPDKPGSPSPDPKKNGCPGLVELKNGQLVIIKPVFFATNKDVILKQSFPVLQSVADALKATPAIKKLAIEGHTDDRGKVAYNVDLSDRRAKSVLRWLTEHGIAADRLTAQGFGPNKPIAPNDTDQGRAKNRRVDFLIVDPKQAEGIKVEDAKAVEAPAVIDRDPDKKHHHRSKSDAADSAPDAAGDAAGKKHHHRSKTDAADGAPDAAAGDAAGKKHHHRSKADAADSAPAADAADETGKKHHHRSKADAADSAPAADAGAADAGKKHHHRSKKPAEQ